MHLKTKGSNQDLTQSLMLLLTTLSAQFLACIADKWCLFNNAEIFFLSFSLFKPPKTQCCVLRIFIRDLKSDKLNRQTSTKQMIRADQSHVGICQIIASSSTQTADSQRQFEKFSECLLHVIKIIKVFFFQFDQYNFYPKYVFSYRAF